MALLQTLSLIAKARQKKQEALAARRDVLADPSYDAADTAYAMHDLFRYALLHSRDARRFERDIAACFDGGDK